MKITKSDILRFIERVALGLVILMPICIITSRGLSVMNMNIGGALFIISLAITKDFRFLKQKWLIAALIFWLYLILRSLFQATIEETAAPLGPPLYYARGFLYALLFQNIVIKNDRVAINKYLIWSSFIAIMFFMINGYVQFILGKDLLGIPIRDEGYYKRITSFSAGPFCAQLVSMFVFPLLSISLFYFAIHKKTIKISHFFFYLLVAGFILISGERAAMLGLLIGGAIVVMVVFKYRAKLALAFTTSVTVLLGVFYFTVPSSIIDRQLHGLINSIKNFENSDYGQLWIAGFRIGLEHPIFGVGTKNYEKYCKLISNYCEKVPHSPYVHMFSEYGLVGLILYIVLLYYIFSELILSFKKITDQFSKFLLFGVIITIVQRVLVVTSVSFFAHWYTIMLWFMIGWGLYIIRISDRLVNKLR